MRIYASRRRRRKCSRREDDIIENIIGSDLWIKAYYGCITYYMKFVDKYEFYGEDVYEVCMIHYNSMYSTYQGVRENLINSIMNPKIESLNRDNFDLAEPVNIITQSELLDILEEEIG